jgi:hypothetical protein
MTAGEIPAARGSARREGRQWPCRSPVHDGVNIVLGDAAATRCGPMDSVEGHYDRNSRPRPVSAPPDFVTVLATKGPLATKRIIWTLGATEPTIEPSEARS